MIYWQSYHSLKMANIFWFKKMPNYQVILHHVDHQLCYDEIHVCRQGHVTIQLLGYIFKTEIWWFTCKLILIPYSLESSVMPSGITRQQDSLILNAHQRVFWVSPMPQPEIVLASLPMLHQSVDFPPHPIRVFWLSPKPYQRVFPHAPSGGVLIPPTPYQRVFWLPWLPPHTP